MCTCVSPCDACVPKLCYHGELFGKGTLWTISTEDIKMHFKNQSSSYMHRSRLEGHIKNLVTVVASGEGNWRIDQWAERDLLFTVYCFIFSLYHHHVILFQKLSPQLICQGCSWKTFAGSYILFDSCTLLPRRKLGL